MSTLSRAFLVIAVIIGSMIGATTMAGGTHSDGKQVELTGNIALLPPQGIAGDWQVGDTVVVVNGFTEIDILDGSVELGACVAVEGESMPGGALLAGFIMTLAESECSAPKTASDKGGSNDDDDDGPGCCKPAPGPNPGASKADFVGTVSTLPSNNTKPAQSNSINKVGRV